jgi:hypothetical protein
MKTLFKILLAIILLYQGNLCVAQSNPTYPIKEQYDKRNTDFVDNGYDPCNIYSRKTGLQKIKPELIEIFYSSNL